MQHTKRPYTKPVLRTYGKLQDLTQAVTVDGMRSDNAGGSAVLNKT